MRRTAAGMWRVDGDVSLWGRPFLGAFVFAKRRDSSRSSFSLTACSMIIARSPSGTDERISAFKRSNLSRNSTPAVNSTL
jgi:hypothetical protein